VLPLERTEWRIKNGIEKVVGMDEIDWDGVKKTIDDFRNSRENTMPCVDLVTEQVDQLTTNFDGIDMIVIDGLYAIGCQEADLKVFIELTYHETKKAQSSRGKEPQNEYRMRVLEQEHKAVQSLKQYADILIDKAYKVRLA
jgi:uridine kinase